MMIRQSILSWPNQLSTLFSLNGLSCFSWRIIS